METPASILDFEIFFELTHDLLCIAGFDGYFKRVNPAVCTTLGYTEAELMASPISVLIHPDDKARTAEHRRQLLNGIPLLHFENRYITKHGQAIWLSWTSIPVGKDEVVYAIAKDITHKKQLEEERQQTISSLSALNNDLHLLTKSTSHDLRTPVNNLLAVFSMLDISKIEDEETLEFIDMLRSASLSLKKTLNEYVDILNTKGSYLPKTEEVCIETALKDVTDSLKSLLDSTATVLEYDFSELKVVDFDKKYLKSIFLNLISNSIKYARSGHNPVISIVAKEADGMKQLVYSDQGQGFDLTAIGDKIFGLHQRFHNGEDSKGIGLYLVHSHVVRLGGSISVKSEPNKGAKFTIVFPGSSGI